MRKGNMKDRFINTVKNTPPVIPKEEGFPDNGEFIITYKKGDNTTVTKVIFLNGIVINTIPIITANKPYHTEFRGKTKKSILNYLKEAIQRGVEVYTKQVDN